MMCMLHFMYIETIESRKKVEVPAISFNYTFHDEFLRTLSFCDVKLKCFLLQVERRNWIWSCCWWTLQRIQLPYRRQFIFPRLQRRGVVGGKMMNRNLINFAYMGKTTLTVHCCSSCDFMLWAERAGEGKVVKFLKSQLSLLSAKMLNSTGTIDLVSVNLAISCHFTVVSTFLHTQNKMFSGPSDNLPECCKHTKGKSDHPSIQAEDEKKQDFVDELAR